MIDMLVDTLALGSQNAAGQLAAQLAREHQDALAGVSASVTRMLADTQGPINLAAARAAEQITRDNQKALAGVTASVTRMLADTQRPINLAAARAAEQITRDNQKALAGVTASVTRMLAGYGASTFAAGLAGPNSMRDLASAFSSVSNAELRSVWEEASTPSSEAPETTRVVRRLQDAVPAVPPAVLVVLIVCFVWLVSMGLLSTASFENSDAAKEFISLTGLSPAFVATALAGWSGCAVKRWQDRDS